MISNKGDLKSKAADYVNRLDLDAQMDDFVTAVHIIIDEAAGPLEPLVKDSDTNSLLAYDPNIYLYGVVAEAAAYLRDTDLLAIYGSKFAKRIQKLRGKGDGLLRMRLGHPTP